MFYDSPVKYGAMSHDLLVKNPPVVYFKDRSDSCKIFNPQLLRLFILGSEI